jgi:putative nucleotidyltransferase with HDIG domain
MSAPSPLPLSTRVYAWTVVAVGVSLIGTSALEVTTTIGDLRLLALNGLAAVSGLGLNRVRGLPANVSIGEAFSLASLFMFGPAAGAITAAVDSLCCDLRLRGAEPVQLAFNVAAPSIAVFAAGTVVYGVVGAPLPGGHGHWLPTAAGAVTTVALFFALQTALLAVALAPQRSASFLAVWRQVATLWVSPAVGGYVAFLIAVFGQALTTGAVLWLLPLPMLMYAAVGVWLGRIGDRMRHLEEREREYQATIECLATAVDTKDEVTHGHVRRVQEYGRALAGAIGLADASRLDALEAACVLHDIGKLGIPERILNKPGRLTPAEFEVMKQHVAIGVRILSRSESLQAVVPIVDHHHENWDGSGYPHGVRGEDIALGARILSIIDCFDALTSDRPYRRRMPVHEAIHVLRSRRGTMYDPRLVDTFVALQPSLTHLLPADAPTQSPPERIAVSPAPVAVLQLLSSVAAAVHGWTVTWWERETNRDRAVMRAASGPLAGEVIGVVVPYEHGVSGWVMAHREPLQTTDGRLDLGGLVPSAAIIPCISEPLEIHGRRGTLTLYALSPGAVAADVAVAGLREALSVRSVQQSSRIGIPAAS